MPGKITYNQLQKIFPNKFETGGDPGRDPAKADEKVPGVVQVASRITGKTPDEILHVAMTPRKTVLVVSPFMSENPAKADLMARYAKRCVQDSIKRNEAPLCSHLFYYDVLNMNQPIERDWGLQSMLSWIPNADLMAVYVDFGITQAMQVMINTAQLRSRKLEYRMITATA